MWASLMNLVAPEPTEEEQLVSSIQHGRVDGLDAWLASKGLDALEAVKVGENELNVLHVACFYGNLPAVVKLLEYFPFDKPTKGGNTCCHLAAMGGHIAVADVLLEKGAQVTVKNLQGQTVYDVSKGLELRQKLMVLMLQEEQRNGTAPVIAGVTRDRNRDEERLRDLAPPPTSFPMGAPMPTGPNLSAFQPDGFGTTVGRPDLAAKYGNQTQNRLVSDQPGLQPQQQWAPPIMAPNVRPMSASQRYVVSTPGFNVATAAPRTASQPMAYLAPRPAGQRINVFNPGEIAAQQPSGDAARLPLASTTSAFNGGMQQQEQYGGQQQARSVYYGGQPPTFQHQDQPAAPQHPQQNPHSAPGYQQNYQ